MQAYYDDRGLWGGALILASNDDTFVVVIQLLNCPCYVCLHAFQYVRLRPRSMAK